MSPPGTTDPTLVSGPVGQRLTIPTHVTPTGGEATHPSVVFIPEGWNGFAYWMAHTPFPAGNNDHEDPNVVASNDGIDWQVPAGLVNPIDDASGQPAFNSDVDLRMGPNSTLFLFWRFFDPNAVGAEENLYYSTSTDGVTWAAKILFYSTDQTLRRLLSPCLLHEQGTWTMWAVDIVDSPNRVVRLTGGALPENTWSEPVTVDVGPMQTGKEPWHLGLAKVEDWYVGLLTDATTDTSGLDGDDLFIAGQDGFTFANSGATVIPRFQPGEHDQLYRATLLPDTDAGVAGYRVWYSAWLLGPPQIWNIYRTFISEPPPPGPPPPTPSPVAVAAIRTEITWYGCDLITGRIIAPIPDVRGMVERVLGAYTTSSLTVPITPRGPVPLGTLLQATTRWRTMVVAVVNDVPAWGGIITRRRRGTGPVMELSCSTPEIYLTVRRVRDHALTGVDEATIAAVLAGDAGDLPGVGSGIGLQIDAPLTGTLRDRAYEATNRQTVYDRMQELMAVDGGPEWTIDLDWADSTRTSVVKILRVRKRIGVESPALFQASGAPVITSIGSSDAVYAFDEDSSSDNVYANYVVAYSSGEGEDQPESVPAVDTAALNAGTPVVERHWQPSTSISTQSVLDAHAQAELNRVRNGAELWEITARFDAYPRYGVDWQLGDDVRFELTGHGHPKTAVGQARVIGWALDHEKQLIVPKLLNPAGGS